MLKRLLVIYKMLDRSAVDTFSLFLISFLKVGPTITQKFSLGGMHTLPLLNYGSGDDRVKDVSEVHVAGNCFFFHCGDALLTHREVDERGSQRNCWRVCWTGATRAVEPEGNCKDSDGFPSIV